MQISQRSPLALSNRSITEVIVSRRIPRGQVLLKVLVDVENRLPVLRLHHSISIAIVDKGGGGFRSTIADELVYCGEVGRLDPVSTSGGIGNPYLINFAIEIAAYSTIVLTRNINIRYYAWQRR